VWISCLSIFQRDFKPEKKEKNIFEAVLKKRFRQAEVIAIKTFSEKKHFRVNCICFLSEDKTNFSAKFFSQHKYGIIEDSCKT
jgi:hypothetical protein